MSLWNAKPVRIADGSWEWIGFKNPYALLLGNVKAGLRSLPSSCEVAMVEDLWLKPKVRGLLSGFWIYRFVFPFRNRTIIAGADFRSGAFIRVKRGSSAPNGPWTFKAWESELRLRLQKEVSVKQTTVRVLPGVFRWVLSVNKIYQLPFHGTGALSPAKIRVVVCYRDRSNLTCGLLKDLAKQLISADQVELVLVNNQSKPRHAEYVRKAARKLRAPWKVEHVDYNFAYNHSAQNQLAVENSDADVFLFLNNDVRISDPYVIQSLAKYALMPGVASAGPRILGNNGRLISAGIQVYPRKDTPGGISLCESQCHVFSSDVRETSGNSFACAAVAASVFRQLGGLDAAQFPTQYNDADYALRASQQGFTHLYVGSTQIIHQPGQTEKALKKLPQLTTRDERLRQTFESLLNRHRPLDEHLYRDPQSYRFRSLREFRSEFRAIFPRAFPVLKALSLVGGNK